MHEGLVPEQERAGDHKGVLLYVGAQIVHHIAAVVFFSLVPSLQKSHSFHSADSHAPASTISLMVILCPEERCS